jgi:kynureninase
MDVPAPPPEPATGLLVVAAPVGDGDVATLCERLRAVVGASDAEVVVCDVDALAANARAIETVARLQLTARRLGRRIRLQRASQELEQLLAFAGLADVVAVGSGLRGRSRHAEQRKHPCRVEKRVDGDDPPV